MKCVNNPCGPEKRANFAKIGLSRCSYSEEGLSIGKYVFITTFEVCDNPRYTELSCAELTVRYTLLHFIAEALNIVLLRLFYHRNQILYIRTWTTSDVFSIRILAISDEDDKRLTSSAGFAL